MKIWGFHKGVKIPRLLGSLALITCIVLVVSGFLYAYSVPLSRLVVNSINSRLEETVASKLQIPNVKIAYDKISWAGFQRPLSVTIKDVAIQNEQASLTAKEAKVSLNLWKVLLGTFQIRSLKVYDAALSFKDTQLLSGSTKIYLNGDHIRIKGNVAATSLDRLTDMPFVPPWVKGMQLPLKGSYSMEFSPTAGLKQASLDLRVSQVSIAFPDVFPEPVSIDELSLEVSATGQDLTLKHLKMKHGKTQCSLVGSLHASVNWLHLLQQGGTVTMTSQATAEHIALDELKNLWPIPLTPTPRRWVTENLSVGEAKAITLSLAGSAEMGKEGNDFAVNMSTVAGQIDADNVTVQYLGDLPPVVGVSGICTFTKQQFDINANTGIVNEVLLEQGRVLITNLDQEDHKIAINLQLKGPLRKKLEVLSAQPLAFPQKLGLDSANVSGDSLTNVTLEFPLEQNLPLSSVTVNSKSSITDGSVKTSIPAGNDKVKLSKGTFELETDTHHLSLVGKAELNGLPADITWRENFDDDASFRRQFLVKAEAQADKLGKVVGFDLSSYLKGEVNVDLIYTGENSKDGVLETTIDLQKSRMLLPLFRWEKAPKQAAKMILKMKINKNGTNQLQTLSVTAPHLAITAKGSFNPNQSIQLTVPDLRVGQNKLNISLTTKGKTRNLNIHAKTLDLGEIFKDTDAQEWPVAEYPWHITLKADTVNLENQGLVDLNGTLTYHRDNIQKAQFTGKFYPSRHPFQFNITPPAKKEQHFELKTKNGGELLAILGVTDAIQGGDLTLNGIKTLTQKSWQIGGQLNLSSFSIRNAPLLTRLLAAASPTGMINLLSGQNLQMSSGEAHFLLTPQHLIIENARASSTALALVIHGHVDRKKNFVDLAGEVVPLYALNTALAHIPLIGTILSGNDSEGIFVTTYTLKGPKANPELSINPLSTFTPGIIRRAFGG